MELKDVILSTLAEMEDTPQKQEAPRFEVKETVAVEKPQEQEVFIQEESHESEIIYLNSIKERLLVLFEGFQAPNNTNIEAKIDMTLNFLEYTLATIESRVTKLEKEKK